MTFLEMLESQLKLFQLIRHLLLVGLIASGLAAASMASAAISDRPLPALTADRQGLPLAGCDEKWRNTGTEMAKAPELAREQHQWLMRQWAALSPEQRDQLRNQVREHRQRMPPEQRQQLREERRVWERPAPEYEDAGRQEEDRLQRFSPDERREFRQWMRERRGDRRQQ